MIIGYCQRNAKRMRYISFRDQQLCFSSVVVEVGCENTIDTRLKQSVIHWTEVRGKRNRSIALQPKKQTLR